MIKGRAALLLALVGGLLFVPATGWAHSELESSRPAEGATANKPPDHIVLRFSETPTKDSVVTVSDGCSKDLVDDSFVAGNAFHVQIEGGTGGKYEVDYALVSADDGHATEGSYTFTVKGAVDCSADDGSDKPDDKGNDDTSGNDDDTSGNDDTDQAGQGTEPASDEDDSSSPMVPILIGGAAAIVIALVVRVATRK